MEVQLTSLFPLPLCIQYGKDHTSSTFRISSKTSTTFENIWKGLVFNPLKHSVSGAETLTQNSQLLKCIPETSNEFFTLIIYLEIALTVLGIGLFFLILVGFQYKRIVISLCRKGLRIG